MADHSDGGLAHDYLYQKTRVGEMSTAQRAPLWGEEVNSHCNSADEACLPIRVVLEHGEIDGE